MGNTIADEGQIGPLMPTSSQGRQRSSEPERRCIFVFVLPMSSGGGEALDQSSRTWSCKHHLVLSYTGN